jgi:hypothetical protein
MKLRNNSNKKGNGLLRNVHEIVEGVLAVYLRPIYTLHSRTTHNTSDKMSKTKTSAA